MQVFVRVTESGSFSRAAASLNLANATVTACVRNLEKHLGATLINRNTRFLCLTDAGEQFLRDSRQILQAVERAESDIQSAIGELRGTLRMEVPIAIGQALICPALSLFAARHPRLSLAVTLTNQTHNMIENAIDVAIRMGRVEEADMVARPIFEGRYLVCGRPDVVDRLPAHPSQLDPRLCLGLVDEGGFVPAGWQLEREGEEPVFVRPDGPLHFNSSNALIGAALQGTGLVHVLDVYADAYVASGELACAYPEWTTGIKPFYAVTPKTRVMSTKIRTLIDFLLETLDAQRRPRPWEAVRTGPAAAWRP
ncbi:LysR family transcriptional regulator [Pigmentiphaga soli]|uniref:LysR family transcriptional regulator n=2 Tax=Pigmentiphaga soli TaxID=1007095 RepID=A0ABP8HMZ0_9BURK